jgi:uncharacterized protein (DUF433 family)
MPVYVCYRGDCDNLASLQPGRNLFVAQDAIERNWLCVETELKQLPSESSPELMEELMRAQALLHEKGLSVEGTEQTVLECADEKSLRRQLVLQTYPAEQNSIAKLERGGWLCQHLVKLAGLPYTLFLSQGQYALKLEGETANEVWYRAVQQTPMYQAEAPEGETMSSLTIQNDPVPLRKDEQGAIRIGESQVLLDVVIREFKNGAIPEEIAEAYPTVQSPDVYAVIGYYLRHKEEVDRYLETRRAEAEALRQEIEAKQPDRSGLRAKLLARRAQLEQEHASSGK